MAGAPGIQGELTIGDVISRTFDIYRQDFTKYLIIFLIVETITGILSAILNYFVLVPTLAIATTPGQTLADLGSVFQALGLVLLVSLLVALLLGPISNGTAIMLASDRIQKGQVDLGRSFNFTLSKLVWLWILGLIVGIIVVLGSVALIVPGIILAIMFSLSVNALLIENKGVTESMGRSRQLVGGRWLKTFGLYIILGILIIIAGIIADLISAPFGPVRPVVSSIISAFYLPLVPILVTVYYYSNLARTSPPMMTSPAGSAPVTGQPSMTPAGFKFCPNCGTQLVSSAMFCSKCGAKQPS